MRLHGFRSLLIAVIALLAGCGTVQSRSLPQSPQVTNAADLLPSGKAAVAVSAQAPQIKVGGLGGWGERAVQGMIGAMQMCDFDRAALNNAKDGKSADALRQAELTITLPVLAALSGACAAIAVPKGALDGALATPSASEVQETLGKFSPHLNAQAVQDTLRDKFLAAARNDGRQLAAIPPSPALDYRPAAANGTDTVIELAITDVELKGAGVDPPLALTMEAHARLIRTRDNAEIYSDYFSYQGERLKLSEWSADNAARLAHGLATGYQTLAADIYNHVYLQHPSPDR